jgi:hypothetical protein
MYGIADIGQFIIPGNETNMVDFGNCYGLGTYGNTQCRPNSVYVSPFLR